MVWNLHPVNYSQALGPNFSNMSYGRSGTYKGMGGYGLPQWRQRFGLGQMQLIPRWRQRFGLGQTLPPPEVSTPSDQSQNGVMMDTTATVLGTTTGQDLAQLSASGTLANPGAASAVNTPQVQWGTVALVGGGALLILLLASGGKRR
jgi:hypothetical protein